MLKTIHIGLLRKVTQSTGDVITMGRNLLWSYYSCVVLAKSLGLCLCFLISKMALVGITKRFVDLWELNKIIHLGQSEQYMAHCNQSGNAIIYMAATVLLGSQAGWWKPDQLYFTPVLNFKDPRVSNSRSILSTERENQSQSMSSRQINLLGRNFHLRQCWWWTKRRYNSGR